MIERSNQTRRQARKGTEMPLITKRETWVLAVILITSVLAPCARGDDKREEQDKTNIERFMEQQLQREVLEQRQRELLLQMRPEDDANSAVAHDLWSDYAAYGFDPLGWADYWYLSPWAGFVNPLWYVRCGTRHRPAHGNENGASAAPAGSTVGKNTSSVAGQASSESPSAPRRLSRGHGPIRAWVAGANLPRHAADGAASPRAGSRSSITSGQPGNRQGPQQGPGIGQTRLASAAGVSGISYGGGHSGRSAVATVAAPPRGATGVTYSPRPAVSGPRGSSTMLAQGGIDGGSPGVHPSFSGGMHPGYCGGVHPGFWGVHPGFWGGGAGGMHFGGYSGGMGGTHFGGGHGGGRR